MLALPVIHVIVLRGFTQYNGMIRLTAVIIEAYHCYHLQGTFYSQFLPDG
jgi:hypothetical protein